MKFCKEKKIIHLPYIAKGLGNVLHIGTPSVNELISLIS